MLPTLEAGGSGSMPSLRGNVGCQGGFRTFSLQLPTSLRKDISPIKSIFIGPQIQHNQIRQGKFGGHADVDIIYMYCSSLFSIICFWKHKRSRIIEVSFLMNMTNGIKLLYY
jgi:hypothetical protein